MPTSGVAAPALLEALPDVVVVADARGRIVYTNPAVAPCSGTSRGTCAAAPDGAHPRATAGRARPRVRALPGHRPGTLVGATTQVPALHADGSEVAVELTLSRLDGGLDGAAPTDQS